MTKYHVLIEKDEEGGYVGKVPELPGCLTQGDSLDELMANVREAIELCLEVQENEKPAPLGGAFVGIQEIEV